MKRLPKHRKLKIEGFMFTGAPEYVTAFLTFSLYLTHKTYKMVDKTCLIRHMQKKNISFMVRTRIILFSSFVIYIFCICHLGSVPILSMSLRFFSLPLKIEPSGRGAPFLLVI